MSSSPEHEPQELGELRKVLSEFVQRFTHVENEIANLKEDQKTLIEDYEDKLDIKTLKQAMRIVKAKRKVQHLDTFEKYEDILSEMGEL